MLTFLSIFKKQIVKRQKEERMLCSNGQKGKIFDSYNARNDGTKMKNKRICFREYSKIHSPANNIKIESISNSNFINNSLKFNQIQDVLGSDMQSKRSPLKLNIVSIYESNLPRARSTYNSSIKRKNSNSNSFDTKKEIIGKLFESLNKYKKVGQVKRFKSNLNKNLNFNKMLEKLYEKNLDSDEHEMSNILEIKNEKKIVIYNYLNPFSKNNLPNNKYKINSDLQKNNNQYKLIQKGSSNIKRNVTVLSSRANAYPLQNISNETKIISSSENNNCFLIPIKIVIRPKTQNFKEK